MLDTENAESLALFDANGDGLLNLLTAGQKSGN